LGLGLRV
jgi:hypothetical protein